MFQILEGVCDFCIEPNMQLQEIREDFYAKRISDESFRKQIELILDEYKVNCISLNDDYATKICKKCLLKQAALIPENTKCQK